MGHSAIKLPKYAPYSGRTSTAANLTQPLLYACSRYGSGLLIREHILNLLHRRLTAITASVDMTGADILPEFASWEAHFKLQGTISKCACKRKRCKLTISSISSSVRFLTSGRKKYTQATVKKQEGAQM